MLLEKLQIHNTREKLLQGLKSLKIQEDRSLRVITEQAENPPHNSQRKLSTQQSQRSTLGKTSLKTQCTSPKIKSRLDIIQIQMQSKQKPRFKEILRSNAKKLTLNVEHVTVSEPPKLTTFHSEPNENELYKQLMTSKFEQFEEMQQLDQKTIERLNVKVLEHSQKSVSPSPVMRSPMKRHHHHQNSNSLQTQQHSNDLKVPVPQFDYKDAIDEDVVTDRHKFFKKYKLGNKNLQRINQADYRRTIKSQQRLDEYASYHKQQSNLYVSLNKSAEKHNVFQCGLGLVGNSNQLTHANASAMIRNESKVKVFSEALRSPQCKTLTHISLSQNNLSSPKIQHLVANFPPQLQELDLTNNGIDSKAVLVLANYLVKSQIKKVNLENNKIGDIGCSSFCQTLGDHDYLVYLNLSRNGLTEFCTTELSNYIRRTASLYELYLHFNNINSNGAITIWKSLYKNSSIKVFDISYNRTASAECASIMAKVLAKAYPELMHIDISHNGFNEVETLEIKKALALNQNIYGFHFEGNCSKYRVDAVGHLCDQEAERKLRQQRIEECRKNPPTNLKLLEDELIPKSPRPPTEEQLTHVHRFRRIQGLKVVTNGAKFNETDSCWICEGWQEIKFTWVPGKSGGMNVDPIFLHLNFEGYRPVLMTKVQNEFVAYRMCPPNYRVLYFYSNPVQGIQTVAKNELVTQTPISDPLSYEQQEFLYNGDTLIDGNKMNYVNEVYTMTRSVVIDRYVPKVFSKPRDEEKTYDLTNFKNKKSNFWSIEISIFKNYQPDNEALIDECFEYDFSTSKIARVVKDTEIDEVKEVLRGYYPFLFTAFKFYASTLIGASIPSISMNAFAEFIQSTTILDGKIKNNDIDLNFISTNGKDVNYPNVYEKALVRYQFMEVLVRVAMDKYFRSGICKSQKASLIKLFEDDLVKHKLQDYDKSQDWRDYRYWNEPCDLLIKERLPMLKILFKYTSKLTQKTKYYKNIWVQYKDFRDLLNKGEVFCDLLVERDAYYAYLLSMMTQVDELYSSRHFQMEFYEFLEALARVAEKVSLIRTVEQMTMDDRRQEPLHKKLDALTLLLYLRVGDSIRQHFKDSSEDLTEFDKCMQKKQKNLKQQIEDNGEEDEEKPFDPTVELSNIQEQLKQVLVQQNPGGKKMSFMQLLKQAQQQKAVKTAFNLQNVVQFFKQKEQEEQQKLEQMET